jgi:transcription-repair coupling factor (superfamily II helicase)
MLIDTLLSLKSYQEVREAIQAGESIAGLGLLRSARLPFLAALYQDLHVPILFLTDRMDHALTILDEIPFWGKDISFQLYPEPNPLFYEQAAWGTVTRRDRLKSLGSLAIYHNPTINKPEYPPVIIAPARALMTRTLPRRDFIKSTRVIKSGEKYQPDVLFHNWFEMGYQYTNTVLEPGQYSRRGGILDIWPPIDNMPIRLEFFGDVIETMRRFDPATQRTIQKLDSIVVTPAREYLLNKATDLGISIEDVNEFYIPLLHSSPASILDYLPRKSLVLVDDKDLLGSIIEGIEEQSVRQREENISEGVISPDFPIPYLSWSEIEDSLNGHYVIELGHSTAVEPSELSQVFQPGQRFGGRLKNVMTYMGEKIGSGEKVIVVSRQIDRLKELWKDEFHEQDGMVDEVTFVGGVLSEGWILTPDDYPRINLLTDSEIFGWERPQPRQRHRPIAEAPESAYADLKPGDWVVHIDHGIGIFSGLVNRSLEGVEREFLCVEYENGAQLFVPIYQADRLARYIGAGNQQPTASRLGGIEWMQTKNRVKEGVQEVAKDLLHLYAQRQVAEGFSFSRDTTWQQELEAGFPYIETEDQLKAIADVKTDMESPRPMDRLLCGDVGYGKTEVALRAAFKAVMDNKQVAILVPTTVLAQQHYDTFRQRLTAFPLRVDMLSRFRSPKEQAHILYLLARGEIDIVIGTHRLLQTDVQFRDLGLVIIDEEQRFGVTHKEFLKKLRSNVDVLTLTATPIPRTLYMAMTGVRDISTINTPPEERLPIITHVGPYSPRLVRQAILREMERGGQVFFVHNRVQTIPAMHQHLRKLVPEARVGIAHGQMPENDLAKVMQQFTHNEIDVLLCTSIIESGLDIPNANTLILDRADTFGLAQLYQLRGRVGRGAQRAYTYFFRHRRKPPTIDGEERLEVIAEHTQFGAGYSIAMRDLEMRGAGELLGTRQHGYIADVGFNLYTRLLAQAVRAERLRQGLPAQLEENQTYNKNIIPVNVDLPIPIEIPVSYIPDQNLRLRLYRRLADVQNEREVKILEDEFYDRFGPLPESVKNLFFQMIVKLRAEIKGLSSVSVESGQIVLRYPPLPEGAAARNLPEIDDFVRAGKNAYWLVYESDKNWKDNLLEVLHRIPRG